MNDVIIVPIFDQSAPKIWDDFARVRADSIKKYGLRPSDTDWDAWQLAYRSMWESNKFNFAFGAYYENKMVGFIHGHGTRSGVTIHGLYVAAGTQGRHLGRALLARAENAASLHTRNIELVALGGAMNFYRAQNYVTATPGSNQFFKRVTVPCYSVIPVFRMSSSYTRQFPELVDKNNLRDLSHAGRPAFIWTDGNARVAALALDAGRIACPNSIVYRKFLREFSKLETITEHTR